MKACCVLGVRLFSEQTLNQSTFLRLLKSIKVYCNGKHLYFPRIIQPSMSSYAIDEMKYFFKNPRIKTVSMCKYAFSISCQGKVALLECLDFGSESAREHIKKYSYSILSNMIQEGSEKPAWCQMIYCKR